MDIVAIIISILSLIISITFSIVEYYHSKKINDINLESELFRDIIKEYLTTIFPNAISEIHFNEKRLTSISLLQEALNKFRNSLRFYKYYDEEFYNNLKTKTQEIEDYIVENEDKEFSFEDQGEVTNKIRQQIKELYRLIAKKYKNG